jgi:hypothetical protein
MTLEVGELYKVFGVTHPMGHSIVRLAHDDDAVPWFAGGRLGLKPNHALGCIDLQNGDAVLVLRSMDRKSRPQSGPVIKVLAQGMIGYFPLHQTLYRLKRAESL